VGIPIYAKGAKMKKLDRTELIKEIDTLLIRVGKNYDGALHPALLVATHRDEILVLFDQYAEGIRKEDGFPKIICLCGSTRFVNTFNEWRQKLTLEWKIVLSIEIVTTQSEEQDPQHSNLETKEMLDKLHLRKIDLADEVMILNVSGYIGESTAKEIIYAESVGKPITYLEALKSNQQ
jgi:hypothetical protein